MTDSGAAGKADQYLLALIASQPNFWPTGSLSSPANAEHAAKNLAKFRQTLIEELKKQL